MTVGALRWAGGLAMFSAAITLPLFFYSVQHPPGEGEGPGLVNGLMQVGGAALFVLLALLLRRFLGRRCGFHATDRVIDMMVACNLLISIVTVATLILPQMREAAAMFEIAVLVGFGMLQFRFGALLRTMPNDLGGMRTPYGLLNMATGICLASIVLIPFGIVLSAVADVMLGTIFLQASRSIDTRV